MHVCSGEIEGSISSCSGILFEGSKAQGLTRYPLHGQTATTWIQKTCDDYSLEQDVSFSSLSQMFSKELTIWLLQFRFDSIKLVMRNYVSSELSFLNKTVVCTQRAMCFSERERQKFEGKRFWFHGRHIFIFFVVPRKMRVRATLSDSFYTV